MQPPVIERIATLLEQEHGVVRFDVREPGYLIAHTGGGHSVEAEHRGDTDEVVLSCAVDDLRLADDDAAVDAAFDDWVALIPKQLEDSLDITETGSVLYAQWRLPAGHGDPAEALATFIAWLDRHA